MTDLTTFAALKDSAESSQALLAGTGSASGSNLSRRHPRPAYAPGTLDFPMWLSWRLHGPTATARVGISVQRNYSHKTELCAEKGY